MNIAVSSGKGGTGKTFIATNLAAVAAGGSGNVTYLDCDVEEPNGHLFLPLEDMIVEHMTVRAPERFDPERCTGCGACVDACRYNALAIIKERVLHFDALCHACGVCSLVCPRGAVIEGNKPIGELRHGVNGRIHVHYGLLETAAGGMSPRLIHALKQHARLGLNLLDSPPGTACATVETVKGADLCVLVADPTPFALHDLRLSVNMCRRIGQEPAVVVNRAGLDAAKLNAYCRRAELVVLGEIPDDRRIARAYSVGDLAVEAVPEYRQDFERLLERIREEAGTHRPVRTDLIEAAFEPGGETQRAKAPDGGERPSEIVVISGKGGTGKTSIAGCFAQLADGAAIADCDVDAADLHLILNPEARRGGDFVGGMEVTLDPDACTGCGQCINVCRFAALSRTPVGEVVLDPATCEGCGACEVVCPAGALSSKDAVNGKWTISDTRFGPMSDAVLGYAEENSGRLVTLVRGHAAELARSDGHDRVGDIDVVIDGSPGTGCPVIASITGARYAVVVTEPTVSGLHDLRRVLDLTRHFGVPSGVVVNKADLNTDMTERIRSEAQRAGADLLGTVPYDNAFTEAQIQRQTLIEYGDSPAVAAVQRIWQRLPQHIRKAGVS